MLAREALPARRRQAGVARASGISSPDRVVEAIVQGIRSGRYVPGQKLIEADLTHDLRVSRGPVREALKRLAAEGLVTLSRHRGAYIRALTRTEADETLIVLEVLTGLMARLAAEAVDQGDDVSRMRTALDWLRSYKGVRGSDGDSMDKRRHFYDALAELGGNRQLARILPTLQIHLLRLQMQPYLTDEDHRQQLRDYAQISSAVLAGATRLAERAMRKHIRRARARYARIPDEAFRIPKRTG